MVLVICFVGGEYTPLTSLCTCANIVRYAVLLNERAMATAVWSLVRPRWEADHRWGLREYGLLWNHHSGIGRRLLLPESRL